MQLLEFVGHYMSGLATKVVKPCEDYTNTFWQIDVERLFNKTIIPFLLHRMVTAGGMLSASKKGDMLLCPCLIVEGTAGGGM